MTREDVLREFDRPSLYGMVEDMADEIVRLRAQLQKEARQLVSDLEAAPQPARRPITREELSVVYDIIVAHEENVGVVGYSVWDTLDQIVNTLRLTVEDA